MSLDSLHRRVDRLSEQVPAAQAQEPVTFVFAMHLFTPAEQDQLQRFLEQIEPKYRYKGDGRLDLSELTLEEQDQLGYWIYLEAALQEEDLASTQKYRRRLAMSWEQVIQAFLSLDLSFLPTNHNDPGPRVQEEHCIYHFNRGGHRNIVINHIERNRIREDLIDEMHRWLEFAESYQGIAP